MRHPVPFIGEELIIRDPEDQQDSHGGSLIDEVLSTAEEASSWEDAVASVTPRSNPKVNARISKTDTPPKKIVSGLSAHLDWVAINNGHGLRINVSGNLDQELRKEWQRLLQETANKSIEQFEFNLTQSPALSLTGLGMLLLFKEQKGSQKQDIKLCHCNRQIWELLQWSGMDKYFVIQGVSNK